MTAPRLRVSAVESLGLVAVQLDGDDADGVRQSAGITTRREHVEITDGGALLAAIALLERETGLRA